MAEACPIATKDGPGPEIQRQDFSADKKARISILATAWGRLLMRDVRSLQLFPDSSMVERPAVNRQVVGSSPTRGAKAFFARASTKP